MLLLEWTSAVTASILWKPKVVSKNRRCSKRERERGQHSAQDGLKLERNSPWGKLHCLHCRPGINIFWRRKKNHGVTPRSKGACKYLHE